MKPIWIVDDDKSIRWVLEKALERENIPHRSFSSPNDVLNALEKEVPQVLISDIRMPRGNGLDLLQTINASHPQIPVIIMTAYSDLDSAVSSFQGGAFEYITKPFDIDKAIELIRRAVEFSSSAQGNAKELTAWRQESTEIIGQSPAMQEIFRAIGRLAQSHATVLITGESGTGKELVAQALHKHSPRAKGPFISFSTAAVPKELLESELFGHERGAFPGALTLRRGRFEKADGGTLFLDEISDMPFELQTRLLRALTDGHFYRIGCQDPIKANVRIIASTHQNLEARVAAGLFREDLLHRLNLIRLRMPPLRERSERTVFHPHQDPYDQTYKIGNNPYNMPTNFKEFEPGSVQEFMKDGKGFSGIIYGKRGTGKTHMLKHFLYENKKLFDECYLFSETAHLQPKEYNFLPKHHIYRGYDESKLNDIYDKQEKDVQEKLANKKEKYIKDIVIIFDDVISNEKIRHSQAFNGLYTKGRHYHITPIILTQSIGGQNSVPKIVRDNCDIVMGFNAANQVDRMCVM